MLYRIFTLVLICLVVSRTVADPPTFNIGPIPSGELDVFKKQFTYYLNVFGIHLFGTATTPPAKLRHAAVILAEYLDNDEDGKPDNPMVLETMIRRKAFLFMTANERALDRLTTFSKMPAFITAKGSLRLRPIPGATNSMPRWRKCYT